MPPRAGGSRSLHRELVKQVPDFRAAEGTMHRSSSRRRRRSGSGSAWQ